MAGRLNPGPEDFAGYTPCLRAIARGTLKRGKPSVHIRFPAELFAQVRDEAIKRRLSFNAVAIEMIRAGISPED